MRPAAEAGFLKETRCLLPSFEVSMFSHLVSQNHMSQGEVIFMDVIAVSLFVLLKRSTHLSLLQSTLDT